ncbi:MAG: tRNA lysidine(34) synthetase TilS [Sulfitobacter sp.]
MGVAVSGGSDSMALLYLLREFCQLHQIELRAVTVNHCLRVDAGQEAEQVAARCAKIGVPHDTIVWQGWTGEGNLQKAARDARYAKMADWAREHEISTIAVGHTADDQAETVLMRLSRRSGVDGLSGMNARSLRNGITWVRPLLRTRRETLQGYLTARGLSWLDDPSNDDDRFERIKARRALGVLADLGIGAEVLAEVAGHLSQARQALDWQTFLAAKNLIHMQAGAIVLCETGMRLQPDEIQRRLLVRALCWISGTDYSPRRGALSTVMSALRKGQGGTLDGCHVRRIRSKIWIFRELNALKNTISATHDVWDRRWRLHPKVPATHDKALHVRALGLAGLEQCPDWRATGYPHVVLQSTPGIWKEERLVAAPVAGFAQNWQMELEGGPDAFFAALLSH